MPLNCTWICRCSKMLHDFFLNAAPIFSCVRFFIASFDSFDPLTYSTLLVHSTLLSLLPIQPFLSIQSFWPIRPYWPIYPNWPSWPYEGSRILCSSIGWSRRPYSSIWIIKNTLSQFWRLKMKARKCQILLWKLPKFGLKIGI